MHLARVAKGKRDRGYFFVLDSLFRSHGLDQAPYMEGLGDQTPMLHPVSAKRRVDCFRNEHVEPRLFWNDDDFSCLLWCCSFRSEGLGDQTPMLHPVSAKRRVDCFRNEHVEPRLFWNDDDFSCLLWCCSL